MGKLLDTVVAKLQDLELRKQEAAPNYKDDPHAAMAFIKRRNEITYLRGQTGRTLINALRKLPKERQDAFYERCIQPQRRQAFSKAAYETRLDPNSRDGKVLTDWLISDAAFGQNWQTTVAALEEALGQAAADELAEEIAEIVSPDDPNFLPEDKMEYPLQGTIDEIKASLDPFSPDTILTEALLDEVNEELGIVKNAVRAHYDKLDNSVPDAKGVQSMMGMFNYDMQNEFIDKELEGGAYKDKFPTMPSSQATKRSCYAISDLSISPDGFTAQDLEKLKQTKLNVSEPLKSDVLSMTDAMEKLGVDKYNVPGRTTLNLEGTHSPEQIFMSEQGFKFYAYWPLYHARVKLEEAVREKDLDKIRQAHEVYKNTKKEMDGMLKTVRKHPTGLCAGNVNSTRELPDNVANPIPLEHMEDFVGHSQVNGIFCLYALSKNTKSTPKQILEDPAGVMNAAAEDFIKAHGLGSRKTAGSKLTWAFSYSACNDWFSSEWNYQNGMLCVRAFEGVACLADDPKERIRINGMGQIAAACGNAPVNTHIAQWSKLVNATEEQKTLMYQHALLLPEEEFDPLKYADAFDQPDWREKLSTSALIDKMKSEGRLDYGKLLDRLNEIEADAAGKPQEMLTNYSKDGLLTAAQGMFREIIRKASAEERETDAFKAFEKSTSEMLIRSDAVKDAQKKLNTQMRTLQGEKKGWFLSSTNSDEHQKMIRCQNTYKFKLIQMQGKELPAGLSAEDKEYLKTISLKEAYDTARDATFDYCTKKTENGRDLSFSHAVGRERYDASLKSLEALDKMADTLELRSPAQKMIDETRLEILKKRSRNDWTAEKTEKAAAKLMYAMTVAHQTADPEEQKKRLTPNRMDMGILYIRNQTAFKQMVKNEGAKGVADAIAEGHGKFTDAYVKGANDAARKNHEEPGKNPRDMTMEEKGEVWKNQTLKV